MEDRFKQLRICGKAFQVISIIAFVMGSISAVGTMLSQTSAEFPNPRGAALGIFMATLLNTFVLYVTGEIVKILLVIEQNTRKSSV